jgi:Fe-S cluster assembly protein SufD
MLQWLDIARNQAEEKFRSLPMPNQKDENFRFTTLNVPELGGATAKQIQMPLEMEESCVLTLSQESAERKGEVPGALFTDLIRTATLNGTLLKQKLKGDPFPQDKFSQLTLARWKNGTFLHVPAGVKMGVVRSVSQVDAGENYYRHFIALEDGAEATWIQETVGGEEEAFLGDLVEIHLGKGAKLNWIQLQRLGGNTKSAVRQKVTLGEGSHLKVTPLYVGGLLSQVRMHNQLEESSEIEMMGAARGEGNQHFDFWVDMDHVGSNSKSQMNFHFVMGGGSRGVFNGLIQIRKESLNCEASQKSKTLLLGTKATVHAIPKLIIQTDQVKCSHGASVSSINPEQLHYLRSRGISASQAEKMIVSGFTEPVLDRFPVEGLRGRAEGSLDRKLDRYQ